MSKICPVCKIECEDNAKFCGICRNVFEHNPQNNETEKIKCQKCGHYNEVDVIFCSECGNNLTENNIFQNYNNDYNFFSYEKQNNPLELQFTKNSKNIAKNITVTFFVICIIISIIYFIAGFVFSSNLFCSWEEKSMYIAIGIILSIIVFFFGYFVYLLFTILKDIHTQNNIIISLLSKKK